jgi:hypothetical protein
MNRDELLSILSQLDPRVARAINSGQLSIEELLAGLNSNQDDLMSFDIARTMISKDNYFENSRVDITDNNGQLGTVRSESVWHCGHSQKAYPLGGIDSFGHVVCTQCIRYCDRGRHLCCVMDSKFLSNGLTVCDFHCGIWRFIKSKFEKERVR